MWGNHGNRKEGQGCEKAWGVVLTWAKKTTRQTKAAHHGHISTPKQTMNTLWHAVFDPQFCDLKIKTKKG